MNGNNAARLISGNVLIHLVKGNHENDPKKDEEDKWVRFKGLRNENKKRNNLLRYVQDLF